MSTAFSCRVLTTALVLLLRLCWSNPSMFQVTMTRLEGAWVLSMPVVMASCTVGPVTGVAWVEEVSAFSHLEAKKMLRALGRSQPFSWWGMMIN